MLRRIYRHRRRLLLGFMLFALYGWLTRPGAGPVAMWWPLILPAGLMTFFALVIAVRPRWGVTVELFAATVFLQEGLFALAPMLEQRFAETAVPIRLALLLACYFIALNFGRSLNTLVWPAEAGLRGARVIDAPRAALWKALPPEAADPAAGPQVVETVLHTEPGRLRLSRREPLTGVSPIVGERITLSDRCDGTRVEIARTYRRLPLLTTVRLWLEDHPGEVIDVLADQVGPAGRAVPAPARSPARA